MLFEYRRLEIVMKSIDYESISYGKMLGIAALMLALRAGYFLLKRTIEPPRSKEPAEKTEHGQVNRQEAVVELIHCSRFNPLFVNAGRDNAWLSTAIFKVNVPFFIHIDNLL